VEVLIVRHAESMHNISLTESLDSNLSKKGCLQAKCVAYWLRNNFDLSNYEGITSPYLRTIQTACNISKATGLRFTVNGGTREHHINKAERDLAAGGMEIPVRKEQFEDCDLVWPSPFFDGKAVFYKNEELEEFFRRIQLFTDTLDQHKNYLIVGHGASCRTLHEVLCSKDLDGLRRRYDGRKLKPGDFSCSIKNASLSWVVDGKSKWFSRIVHDEEIPGMADDARGCGPTTPDTQQEDHGIDAGFSR
jgi:broad specificity phosphatase PhoE